MALLPELARLHARLDPSALAHLQRLISAWGMLSDLCFADLLLFVPVAGAPDDRFVVLGQVRPTTSQTLHKEDLVGRVLPGAGRPVLAQALRLGEIVEGEAAVSARGEQARTQGIPVRWRGRVVAVLTRESAPSVGRRPGELERVYVETFDRFARMIVRGRFPFEREGAGEAEEAPRVGDGVIILDEGQRIEYASPNAVSALHLMGINSNGVGLRLGELGVHQQAVDDAYATALPSSEELGRGPDVVMLLRCIPLVDGPNVTGALVLLRDVTQLRRLARQLISKDATIREVHHRVKNNLQMISSLLRLQARRLNSKEARSALEEAERRLQSIARVHDILSREAMEQVPFNEIVDDLVRVAADSAFSIEQAVEFYVEGDAGELPAEVATPLAIILQEIVQNAVEHAFVTDDGEPQIGGRIDIKIFGGSDELRIEVHDNGRGLPDGFTVEESDSLGLQIVRRLVESQMGGSIAMESGPERGTVARLAIPLADLPAD